MDRLELLLPMDCPALFEEALSAGFRFEGVLRAPETRAIFGYLATDRFEPIAPYLPRLQNGGLSDGVVTLHVAIPDDADAFFAEQHNDEARRWSLWPPPTKETIIERLTRAQLEWTVGPAGTMAIIDSQSGQTAGKVTLRAVVPPQIADIGYGVLPDFRGRGIATRALRLLAQWAIDTAGYARLELGIKPPNKPSQTVARSAGFTFESIRACRLKSNDGTFSPELHFVRLCSTPSNLVCWTRGPSPSSLSGGADNAIQTDAAVTFGTIPSLHTSAQFIPNAGNLTSFSLPPTSGANT